MVFEKSGKRGLKNRSGKIIIPALYEDIGWSQGEAKPNKKTIGYKDDGLWGLIGIDNKKITATEYTVLYPSPHQLVVAAKKGRLSNRILFGLINVYGKNVIPFRYHGIEHHNQVAIAITKNNGKFLYGLLEYGGNTLIPFTFSKIESLSHNRFAVTDTERKTALYDASGQRKIGFDLDSISTYEDGYAIIYRGHMAGIINTEGRVVVLPRYKAIERKGKKFTLWPYDHWKILDANNKKVASLYFDDIEAIERSRFRVSANHYQWIIDSNGKALTPTNYTYIEEISKDKAIFQKGIKYGFLDLQRGLIVKAKFDSLVFNTPFIYTQQKERGQVLWSVYDTFGIEKTRTAYENIRPYDGRLFAVKRRGHWGFAERSGEEVIHCVYDSVGSFVGNNTVVVFHGEYGVLNRYSEWVVLPQPYPIDLVNETLYLMQMDQQTQLRDFEGGLIYFTDNPITNQKNYLLEALPSGGFWKIDFSGTIQRDSNPSGRSFQAIYPPSEGYYGVKLDGKYGFIDENELLRIANRYDSIGFFQEGLAAVKLLGKWGYIDKSERIRIQPTYDEVGPFVKGKSIVRQNGLYGIIDNLGKKIVAENFDRIERLENGRFLVFRNGKKGLLERDGQQLLNAKYHHLIDMNNGYVIVERNRKMGLVTEQGVSTIPLVYTSIQYDPNQDAYLCQQTQSVEHIDLD